MERNMLAVGGVVGGSMRRSHDALHADPNLLGQHRPVHRRSKVKFTLACQLIGFAIYGLIVGEAFAYRIEKERNAMADMLLSTSMQGLSDIRVKGKL
jgi:hypothetical protein